MQPIAAPVVRLLPLLAILAACGTRPPASPTPLAATPPQGERLPTGKWLDPAAGSLALGAAFPLGAVAAPDGRHLAVLMSGYGTQGVLLVDRAHDTVTQVLKQPAAFVGIAATADGRVLYASGGNQDVVYRYDWREDHATLRDSLVLAVKNRHAAGTRYPAGLALSPDGRWLYVAENLADSLAVIDTRSGQVTARYPSGRYPYGVAVSRAGQVYVSAWGGNTVAAFSAGAGDGTLVPRGMIAVGRHPSVLLLSRDGSRLFVASPSTDRVIVMDTRTGQKLVELLDPPPQGPAEGSTPDGLALSADGRTLYVAEADNNAVAVFPLTAGTSGLPARGGSVTGDQLAGRIPTDWYPTTVLTSGDSLVVFTAKGGPPAANPGGTRPGIRGSTSADQYTLGQLEGTMMQLAPGVVDPAELAEYSSRVSRANRWDAGGRAPFRYPPITHVIYIIKENRTYDQVLGDLTQADGDTSLVFFPRSVTPNHHALAERFGIFDRFFVNAEVSADGHNWSMAGYVTDYSEQTIQSNYSGRGRTYDYEGTNRTDENFARDATVIPEDDAAEPANGYLWNLAQRGGITFRNFGEFVLHIGDSTDSDLPMGYRGDKPFLATHTDSTFPGWDLSIPDQVRADVWLKALAGYVAAGSMPALQIVRLPNDHTSGGSAGAPTPRAMVADNDLALGRVIEGLSHSPFWDSTAVFVLEDDAQDGPDHVDSHRSPLLMISPWAAGGVHHRWTNTTDVLSTIADLLHLGSLSQFDFYGAPLRDTWRRTPDPAPYTALTPAVPLTETNPPRTRAAVESARLDFAYEDRNNDDQFSRLLWRMIKGDSVPYPGATRQASVGAMGE